MQDAIGFWLNIVGTAFWVLNFWLIWRISARQDKIMNELREQTRHIDELTSTQHDILQEVHPDVGYIRETIVAASQSLDEVREVSVAQVEMAAQVVEKVQQLDQVTEKVQQLDEVVEKVNGIEEVVSGPFANGSSTKRS